MRVTVPARFNKHRPIRQDCGLSSLHAVHLHFQSSKTDFSNLGVSHGSSFFIDCTDVQSEKGNILRTYVRRQGIYFRKLLPCLHATFMILFATATINIFIANPIFRIKYKAKRCTSLLLKFPICHCLICKINYQYTYSIWNNYALITI